MDMTHEWINGLEPEPPLVLDDGELLRRYALFSPVVHGEDGYYHVFALPPKQDRDQIHRLRDESAIWDPTIGRRVFLSSHVREHYFTVTCGYYGFYKPSIEEILCRAPVDELISAGFDCFRIVPHCKIHRSGKYQVGSVFFSRIVC